VYRVVQILVECYCQFNRSCAGDSGGAYHSESITLPKLVYQCPDLVRPNVSIKCAVPCVPHHANTFDDFVWQPPLGSLKFEPTTVSHATHRRRYFHVEGKGNIKLLRASRHSDEGACHAGFDGNKVVRLGGSRTEPHIQVGEPEFHIMAMAGGDVADGECARA